jgi:hypothetical protein
MEIRVQTREKGTRFVFCRCDMPNESMERDAPNAAPLMLGRSAYEARDAVCVHEHKAKLDRINTALSPLEALVLRPRLGRSLLHRPTIYHSRRYRSFNSIGGTIYATDNSRRNTFWGRNRFDGSVALIFFE